MYRILHITAHMGGGVGKVLSGVSSYTKQNTNDWKHKILMLEKPEKMNFIEKCCLSGVEVEIAKNMQCIKAAIQESDLVQIEWWHHPVMAKFLAEFPQIPVRLLVWCHISGCYYPYIPASFINIPENMLFSSQYSLENPYWTEQEKRKIEKKCNVVYSSGGFDNITAAHIKHEGFNIGYIGTQSYTKIHPEFLEYCTEVANLPDVYFSMIGDRANQSTIRTQVKQYGMEHMFCFFDYVNDVNEEFSKIDIFSYLLNPKHFGTTENVLLEAMAAELPVVCIDQCTEKYLIQHNETGLLVKNKKEYGEAIKFLYEHPSERKRLGENARQWVLENFSVENTTKKLHDIYNNAIKREKRLYDFSAAFGKESYQYFLACLPPELRIKFEENLYHDSVIKIDDLPIILLEKRKSSMQHFAEIYSEDCILQKWANIIR